MTTSNLAAPLTWVIGSGGLLGSSLVARLPTAEIWTPTTATPWGSPKAGGQLMREARRFLDAAGDGDWRVAWCAGAGVTATGPEALATEATLFECVLDALASSAHPRQGAIFLASSAGGAYGGSIGAPFDEFTPARPTSPYGEAKMALEGRSVVFHRETGVPVLVGRIANLYGPRQNLAKSQGLISQVVRAHLLGRPITVYVPLDTVRDNLYVSDAARLIDTGLDRLRRGSSQGAPSHVVKVLASHQAVTIGFLIAELGRLLKRRLRVVYGTSALSAHQSRDLRLSSRVWPELDRVPTVPLPVGMRRVVQELSTSLAAGRLS